MPEGHTIRRLALDQARLLAGGPVRASSPQGRFADGAALLDGRVLQATDAYGKHLFHRYDGDRWLHVHLGLIGRFTHGPLPAPPPRGALRLRLQSDHAYVDLRGAIIVEVLTPIERREMLARLGPDPLRRDARPAPAYDKIRRSSRPIGELMMDQAVLAGVGNVFRAEILFRQRVDPFLPGRRLDAARFLAIWDDLSRLMRLGVRSNRIVSTLPEHRDRGGRVRPEDAHYVYRRAGLPCRVCGNEVRTQVLAGRNLFWCPTDQAD
jgi:endonuclease-8